MNILKRRRTRKLAKQTLQHGTHLKNMREDLMSPAELTELDAKLGRLRGELRGRDYARIEKSAEALYKCAELLAPRRSFPGLRENLEIAVVAIAVAMGFRTYFIQPFKIPTGSMQPTLYGVQARTVDGPGVADRFPLKVCKWMLFGDWYKEVRAKVSGFPGEDRSSANELDPSAFYFRIGGRQHRVPKSADMRLDASQYVQKGSLLWRGIRTVGDHVFVDKVRWNFVRPKRGDIIVFNTDGIADLEATLPKDRTGKTMTTHYIKRLVGLPGETVSISPPDLVINGEKVREPDTIGRIARREGGYEGYQLVDRRRRGPDDPVLEKLSDSITLGSAEYFALGDNTENSRDGRYWGSVPQKNLVGPALMVYWPFSKRWGLVR